MNGTESFVNTLITYIKNRKFDVRCKRFLEVAFCQYTLPPCQCDGKPILFCREDCEKLLEQCGAYLNQLIGTVDFLTKQKDIDFLHLKVPRNCSIFISENSKEPCEHIGLFGKYYNLKFLSSMFHDINRLSFQKGSILVFLYVSVSDQATPFNTQVLACYIAHIAFKKLKKFE